VIGRGAWIAGSLVASVAHASPTCDDAITDPVATPLHEAGLDAQRSACLRDEFAATTIGHALIDTPGFHGLLGGELALSGRFVIAPHLDVGARIRAVDFTFAQTAVNKATETRFGPLGFEVAWGDAVGERTALAVALSAEVPYSRDDMDTVHAAAAIDAMASLQLAPRWQLHTRLGTLAARAASDGGATRRIALRAGADVGWRARPTLGLVAGAETQAGWYGGLDTVMLRAAIHKRFGTLRGWFAIAVPLVGSDRTTAVASLGVARDM